MTDTLRKGILLSFITMVLWAIIDVGMRFTVLEYNVQPFIFTCLMFFVSAVALIAFSGAGHKGISTLKRGHTWFYGVVNIVMNVAEIYAMIYITSTEMNFLNRMTVVMSLIATWFIFNRKPYKSDWIGILFVVSGLVYITWNLDESVRIPALLCILVSASLSTISAMVGETHKDNLEAETVRDQARVTGYVLLACSFLFLILLSSLGYLKHTLDSDYVINNLLLQATPDLSAFIHKPTYYAGLIFGLTVMPLSMYYFFVATKTAKTETFMIVSSTLPFLTFFFEWLASVFGLLDIHAISAGDLMAGSMVVFGAFLMQYLRSKKDAKTAAGESIDDSTLDDYDMVCSALKFCSGDMLLCSKKLDISVDELEQVHAGKGAIGFNADKDTYKHIMRNYHRHIATADALTGLANKDALERSMDTALNLGESFCIAFLDLNKFKPVNDTYGHKVGDEVLRLISERIRNFIPKEHLVSRPHGDEFIIMMHHTNKVEALSLMQELADLIKEPILLENITDEINIGAAFGVAESGVDGNTTEFLLHAADKFMYKDKPEGR